MRAKKVCGAKTKTTGDPCGRPAGAQTDHLGTGRCSLHGGSSPNGRIAAQREQAAVAVATYGLPVDIDPREALLAEVRRSYGAVMWLEAQVRAVAPDALVRGTRGVNRMVKVGTEAGTTTTTDVGPAVNVWLDLFYRERSHLVAVCRAAVAAGIEERRIRLEEQQGAQIAASFQFIQDTARERLALTAAAVGVLRQVLVEALSRLDSGDPFPGVAAITAV